jgi:hypothetical protein
MSKRHRPPRDSGKAGGQHGERQPALAYLVLGLILLALVAVGFFHFTAPLSPQPRPGFAWLATPVNLTAAADPEHLIDPVTKPANLTMKVDAGGEVADLSGPSPINVEYDIEVPCGNKTTDIALYLAGDAALEGIRTDGGHKPQIRQVSGTLPELEQQNMQLVTDTIPDGFLCSTPNAAKNITTVLRVYGRWKHSFYQHSYSKGSVTLPLAGRPWTTSQTAENPPGLRGVWAAPVSSTVRVEVFDLKPTERLDLARPPTENGADLTWQRASNIRVLAVWTDLNRDQRLQIYIFLLGLLGGVGGALVTEGASPFVAAAGRNVSRTVRGLARRGRKA